MKVKDNCVQTNFVSKNLGWKWFGVQIILDPKILGPNTVGSNNLGPNKLGSKRIKVRKILM